MILDKLTFQPGCCNLYHINLRTDIRKYPLYMSKSSRQHSQSVGHGDFIFLHDIHEILKDFCHVNISHICRSILCHQTSNVLIKLAWIWLSAKFSKRQHSILDHADIIKGNTFHCLGNLFPVAFCKSSHHTHVDPDNLTISDSYISRVRIRMKKTVVHDLFDEIVHIFASYFIHIIAIFQQMFLIINGITINVLHHNNRRRGVFFKKNRRIHKCNVPVLLFELFHIPGFNDEIHFLLSDLPQLIQYHFKIHHVSDTDWWNKGYQLVHESDISRHDLINTFSLYLNDHFFSSF